MGPAARQPGTAARAAVPEGARVMTYGSSMGGYAALRFARALRADAILALSPQYSIDPAVVPWEDRWRQDGARIAWLPALAGPLDPNVRPLITSTCRTRDPVPSAPSSCS